MSHHPVPTELKLHQQSRILEIIFDTGLRSSLSCEYLRVYSPSAELRGHSGELRLLPGKKHVTILHIEAVGFYAVKFTFDDGHNSGLYTWEILYDLAANQEKYWQHYLDRLEHAKLSRE